VSLYCSKSDHMTLVHSNRTRPKLTMPPGIPDCANLVWTDLALSGPPALCCRGASAEMGNQRKPADKVSIGAASSERLSKETNEVIDQIEFSMTFGNPKRLYIRITRKGFELKGTWTRTLAGIVGIIGLMRWLF
jgi:hypothetical protein